MKKNFLKRLNLLLGTVSVALAGCHVQKQASEQTNNTNTGQEEVVEQPTPAQQQEAVCLYGVPAAVYEQPPRKYGVPDVTE
jgi:starvation-inducible outer membrane lipoprotein